MNRYVCFVPIISSTTKRPISWEDGNRSNIFKKENKVLDSPITRPFLHIYLQKHLTSNPKPKWKHQKDRLDQPITV
jgi:hypothetical protein